MTRPDFTTAPASAPRDEARRLLADAKAVIFDFDGLLVDTEYAIYTSWLRVFQAEGHPLPLDLFNQCLGSGYTHWNPGDHLERLTGKSYDWDAINARRQTEIVSELEHEGLFPGAQELIERLYEAGIPMGVASSSSHRWVDNWLNKLGVMPYFKTVVCRDDGLAVKPAPDLFLRAAQNLGIAPESCLVLEDSQNGVVAAVSAGMKVIAIPNRVTQEADFSKATLVINAIAALTHNA